MKKLTFLLLFGLSISAGAMAQTVNKEQKTLKNSIKNKKEDRKEVGEDLGHLRMKAAVRHRKEVRHHRRSIHRQGEHLENRGVIRPIHKAKVQAKKEKEAEKGKN